MGDGVAPATGCQEGFHEFRVMESARPLTGGGKGRRAALSWSHTDASRDAGAEAQGPGYATFQPALR